MKRALVAAVARTIIWMMIRRKAGLCRVGQVGIPLMVVDKVEEAVKGGRCCLLYQQFMVWIPRLSCHLYEALDRNRDQTPGVR